MPDTLPNLDLPVLLPSQSQKHITHNEALRILDTLTHLSVLSEVTTTPPTTTEEGMRFLVPTGALNAWDGHEGQIASFDNGAWIFYTPKVGWCAFVQDTGILKVFDGTNWHSLGGSLLENLSGLGIGVDTTSAPFSAKLNAALWTALYTADGGNGDLMQSLNKETSSDDGGLVFQTDFTTHALMGLFGSDNFRISVTEDGTNFRDALIVDSATGIADQPNLPRFTGTTNFDNFGDVDAWTRIAINTLSYNDQSSFDATSNVFTAPFDGVYHLGGHLLFKEDTNAAARMSIRLVKNGTEQIAGSFGKITGTHEDGQTFANSNAVVPLVANDTVELQGRFSTFSGYFQADETSFWGYKVG